MSRCDGTDGSAPVCWPHAAVSTETGAVAANTAGSQSCAWPSGALQHRIDRCRHAATHLVRLPQQPVGFVDNQELAVLQREPRCAAHVRY